MICKAGVDVDYVAGDSAAKVAGEEDGGAGYFGGVGVAAEGYAEG